MEQGWYAYLNGQQQGPFTWEELWRKTQTGEIGPADLVWNQSLSGWTRVDQVPGLISVQQPYPGGAMPTPASSPVAPAKKKGKSSLMAVILLLVLLVAGGGGTAYYFLTRNGDSPRKSAEGTGEGQQVAILPHNLPAPPFAVLADSNPAFGYYQYTIDTEIQK